MFVSVFTAHSDSMIRLWVHETLRVFHDRLISQEDRSHFIHVINSKLQVRSNLVTQVMYEPILMRLCVCVDACAIVCV